MTTSATIILAFLAVVFVISGLSKASGNEKGLSGTRDVNVKDGMYTLNGKESEFTTNDENKIREILNYLNDQEKISEKEEALYIGYENFSPNKLLSEYLKLINE